ncbi:adenosylmethionine decarboxylase [Lacibacter sediminis]|uniref:Adenosylmethionine decarboxylase n=1 Tax=Lacibacter sediminis TaxID=2760713 RepID=A0A7G5XFS6_9BACT|nr:adenosylmethionine decarboxylase [Lacibacter sediminis]QNA44329.1 adenosylmethionine decarboxylase [Lacibacter sediminis]
MSYQPGKHLIATLNTAHTANLQKYELCKELIDQLIQEHQLQKLGEVYHNFSPAGFTAVVCLSESHLSLHTWPEYGKVNLDIYLSNFQRSNDGAVQQIFDALQSFFVGDIVHSQTIIR